jgi:hypothetical protein
MSDLPDMGMGSRRRSITLQPRVIVKTASKPGAIKLDAEIKAERGPPTAAQKAKEAKLLSDEQLRERIHSVRQPPKPGSQITS